MKILLIGHGMWGRNYVSTFKLFLGVHLQIATKENWADLVSSGNFHGAIVATQPEKHIAIAQHCLDNNLPVLIEKPLALSEREILSLEKYSLPIIVNYIHLFSPYYQLLKSHLQHQSIQAIDTYGHGSGPIRSYSSLYDYGSHDLSMILDLLGVPPISVRAYKHSTETGELFELHLKFDNCSTYSLVGNGATKKRRSLFITAKHKHFEYDDLSSCKIYGIQNVPIFNQSPLEGAIKTFLNSIDGKIDNRAGLFLSKQILNCLDQCNQQIS